MMNKFATSPSHVASLEAHVTTTLTAATEQASWAQVKIDRIDRYDYRPTKHHHHPWKALWHRILPVLISSL